MLEHFVTNLFENILQVQSGTVPVAVKYLFDFFDSAADRVGFADDDIAHMWKNNR